MDSQNGMMSMDQKIFELDLPVEIVSIYLMCTGIADSGTVLTLEAMLSVWNGTDDELIAGLNELEKKGIILREKGSDNGKGVFEIMPSEKWIS